jgi:Flp pilus assembly CpaE family ATPase
VTLPGAVPGTGGGAGPSGGPSGGHGAVLCAVRGAAESAVVRGLTQASVPVARRCADLAELLASAAAGLGGVAVVSADLPGLDREGIRHLHGSGVRVVVLWEADAGWDAARAARLGADAAVPADRLDVAVRAARSTGRPAVVRGAPSGAVLAGFSGPVAADGDGTTAGGARAACAADAFAVEPPSDPGLPGRVVAVWGPTGAPGRTTVAIGLAEALAPEGALLVDADTYGGTVAPMLGMLDEAPGVAAACRAAATGRLDPVALAALAPTPAPGLRVLTGIGRADRWPEVPAAHLEQVWACARELVPWTVVDCGFGIERDEALSYDTRAPQRHDATLSALAEADTVVVVGSADPISLQRLVRALLDLPDVAPTAQRVVVVTRVRASVAGHRPGPAIRDALGRYAGVGDVHLLPWDPVACDAAVLGGRLLGEVAPHSPLRRALVELAGALRAEAPAVTAH